MKKKAIVLLSAGLDSTVNLFQAHQEREIILALTFIYGQKAALKEIEKARLLCKRLDVPHRVLELAWMRDFTFTSLLNDKVSIPQAEEVNIHSLAQSQKTAQKVWVPNRNGIFLNIAAGYAEGLGAHQVVVGFNQEEGATFPDNTPEFLTSLTQSLSFSTATQVEVVCYTTDKNKTEIVQMGQLLGVPFQDLWPCYLGDEKWCGVCESCQRYFRALKEAQIANPLES